MKLRQIRRRPRPFTRHTRGKLGAIAEFTSEFIGAAPADCWKRELDVALGFALKRENAVEIGPRDYAAEQFAGFWHCRVVVEALGAKKEWPR